MKVTFGYANSHWFSISTAPQKDDEMKKAESAVEDTWTCSHVPVPHRVT